MKTAEEPNQPLKSDSSKLIGTSAERRWFAVDVFIDGNKIVTEKGISERAARREAAFAALSIIKATENEKDDVLSTENT